MSEPRAGAKSADQDPSPWTTDPALRPVVDLTGRTLGDFQIERLLGRGGMGEVYLATQVSLNRPVALKVLKPDLLANPTSLKRFESEAWAAARLSHPNIVHIYTLGSIGDLRFIAMEYVPGTNLHQFIEKKGTPPLPLAFSIMRQAGQGIAAAGAAGLIHRDLKPENLLITRRGEVKIADFGLCRDLESPQGMHLTQSGVTMGTPMYMSPEQVQGQKVDHRSDLYSLGVTFYHMLAGVPPFLAPTGLALALKHVHDTPVSLAVYRPDLPRELVDLVAKLMAKDPAERYQTAAEMLRDLARARAAARVAATSIPQPTAPTIPPATLQQDDCPSRVSTPSLVAPRSQEPAEDLDQRGPWYALRLGWGTIAMLWALALAAGAAWGWTARVERRLGTAADGPPALWMAPWARVPAQPSPEAQYRYALLEAPAGNLEAAWLAVPGRFPQAHTWTARAYTQLGRFLFRHHDLDRIEALAAELKHATPKETRQLAEVLHAAAAALQDDPQGVLDVWDRLNLPDLPLGLREFCLEITRATNRPALGGPNLSRLKKIQRELLTALRIDLLEPFDPSLQTPE
jgi:serine/threonine protein kinase